MTLKDDYQGFKEGEEGEEERYKQGFHIGHVLGNLVILAIYIGLINVLWNALCPIFKLAQVTYVQTMGLLMLITLIKVFFATLVVRKAQ